MDLKAKLSGAAAAAPVVPVVGTLEIEAIVSAWTGIPVDRLSAADTERLSRLPEALTVRILCLTLSGGLHGLRALHGQGSVGRPWCRAKSTVMQRLNEATHHRHASHHALSKSTRHSASFPR